jgi:hypothetical protein
MVLLRTAIETSVKMPTPKFKNEVMLAAIEGFENQKRRIDAQIAELRAMLPGGSPEPATTETTQSAPKPKRRKFSAAALKRMREAQQRRWAKVRDESEPLAPAAVRPAAPKAKRKLSAAGRAAIVAATKKRWDAVHKAQKATTKTAPRKKMMSPARRAALLASLAKARAARAAKRAAA